MRDEAMALAPDPTLVRDRCLSEEFTRLAEDLAIRQLRAPGPRDTDA
jgi:hypothetical protein